MINNNDGDGDGDGDGKSDGDSDGMALQTRRATVMATAMGNDIFRWYFCGAFKPY